MKEKTDYRILLVLIAIPLLILGAGSFSNQEKAEVLKKDGSPITTLNQHMSQWFPFSKQLKQLGLNIRYTTGETKQKNIYLSPQGLLKDISPPDQKITKSNTTSLLNIAKKTRERDEDIDICVAVIPSASAVLQKNLPRFSSPVNQRNTIENIYNQFVGKIATVDCYNALIANQDKYIYYRTEDTLTPLGGYYLYREILSRMLEGEIALDLNDFEVSYGDDYYGSLYEELPYSKVKPDVLTYYYYTQSYRGHKIKREKNGNVLSYSSFYTDKPGLESYLDGSKGRINITSTSAYDIHLLVLGDSTAISYLPFLANHYGEITFINIEDKSPMFSGLNIDKVDQILFAVGVENYTNKELMRPVEKYIYSFWQS